MFEIPEWESHNNAEKVHPKVKQIKLGYVNKSKGLKQTKKIKLKKNILPQLSEKPSQELQTQKPMLKKSVTTNKTFKADNKNKGIKNRDKTNIDYIQTPKVKTALRKRPVTHQTLFLKAEKRRKLKPTHIDSTKNSAYDFNINKSKNLSLREQMLQKLKSARFRYLNEQMYTNIGKDAKKYFDKNPNAYMAYHEGYRQQVAKWPLNPIDIIIRKIKKLPQHFVIADFGCGEAKLAKSTSHSVHCFDLVAVDETVTACDMAHVPLQDNSVNVVVFCLSLMGTNIKEYILEANRVLKNKGQLLIAEVESRFEDVEVFVKNMRSYGFVNKIKDFSHDLFLFLDFVKESTKPQRNLSDINLKPCLYKKR